MRVAAKECGAKKVVYAFIGVREHSGSAERGGDDSESEVAVWNSLENVNSGSSQGVQGEDRGIVGYFNVFGPRQDPASRYAAVIPRLL